MVATLDLLDALGLAAREAGAAILKIVRAGFEVECKADDSPVTIADRAAEAVILEALARLAPDIPVVAEEQVAAGRVPVHGDTFFLVDALDGTKEFVRGGSDYTVNIALIEDGSPVLGIIYVPVTDRLYLGLVGHGAWREEGGKREPIATRARADLPTAVASKSHLSEATLTYLDALFGEGSYERVSVGSSLKFCLVAEGKADCYARLSPTCEWDIAAGAAILRAAGGRLDGPEGAPMRYGKPDYLNAGFVATAGWSAPPIGC